MRETAGEPLAQKVKRRPLLIHVIDHNRGPWTYTYENLYIVFTYFFLAHETYSSPQNKIESDRVRIIQITDLQDKHGKDCRSGLVPEDQNVNEVRYSRPGVHPTQFAAQSANIQHLVFKHKQLPKFVVALTIQNHIFEILHRHDTLQGEIGQSVNVDGVMEIL